ncbi:MAG: hypothetical protein Q7J25_04760 [Vicinamibacterales bacterium]|nr:hypothetical protein [Vicinamibacterales bacterium]
MSRRAWLISAIGFALVTRVMVAPLIDLDNLSDASYPGDARLLIWTLAWDAHALLTGRPLFDANMFFPQAGALGWAEHHIGIGLFAAPVYALTHDPVYAYWCIWLAAFVLNGLAMQALAFRITRDAVASFGAGLVYAFCFFRMHHAHGHVQMLWTWALPLALVAADRWVERPTAGRTATVTALVVVQALSGWYLAVDVALLLIVAAPFLLIRRPLTVRHAISGAGAVAVAFPAVLWFAGAYTHLAGNSLAEVMGNSADLASYLVPPENTRLGQWVATHTSLKPRWIWGEQTLYAGGVTLVLGLLGTWAWTRRRDRLSAAVLVAGGIALALSFGPGTAGHMPFDYFATLPVMGLLRAPARMALLVMLALSMLVAMEGAWLRSRSRLPATIVLAVAAAVGLWESYVVSFPGGTPPREPVPAVYTRLASLPAGPVLSLPTYRFAPDNFREADYLLFSTAHWLPIVNGFGRHEPKAHKEQMEVLSRFPALDAVSRLRQIGVRYVVLHPSRASELARAAAEAEQVPGVRLVAHDGDDFLFEVGPALSVR